MTTVEARLAAVERQLRAQRAVIAALLLALAALVGYGATNGIPDVVRARKFELVDSGGAIRASLRIDNTRVVDKSAMTPSITFFNSSGADLVTIGENYAKEGYISIRSSSYNAPHGGVGSLWFGMGADQNPAIELTPKKWHGIGSMIKLDTAPRKPVIDIKASTSNSADILDPNSTLVSIWSEPYPALQLNGKDGKTQVFAVVTPTKGGAVQVSDANGRKGAQLLGRNDRGGGGGVVVFNKTGEEVVQAIADEYGMGSVGAFDRHGKGHTLTPR